MKKLKVKLQLTDETLLQLSVFKNIDQGLSDMINDYYTHGKGRPREEGLSKETILHRAYYNHKKTLNLSYTKEAFTTWFITDNKFNKLYKDYFESNFDRQLAPSFKKNKKLKKIRVMTYAEIMQRGNSTPITRDYYGDITNYPSANAAARALNMNVTTLKKTIKHGLGYRGDINDKLYYT